MTKFPSHLITKRIQKEILADAAKLYATTLHQDLPVDEATLPLPDGFMLEIRFSPERESGDWLRVAFVKRSETTIGNHAYRIGYDGACCGLPVTPMVLGLSIMPQFFEPFKKMITSGLREKEVQNWVLGVSQLAVMSQGVRRDLLIATSLVSRKEDLRPQ